MAVLYGAMPIEFDQSNWPIVVCRAAGSSTDEDIATYTSVLQQILDRAEPHVIIVDARTGEKLNSRHRRMVAEWNEKNSEALKRYRASLFLVTPSTLLRGMITAVHWLFPPPFPYRAVENMSQAMFDAAQVLAHHSATGGRVQAGA